MDEKTVHVLRPVERDYLLKDWDPRDDNLEISTIVSDASDSRAYTYEADTLRLSADFPFNMNEQKQSSSLRELLSVKNIFEHRPDFIKEKAGKGICWLTDSQVLVWFLTRGSKKVDIQKIILKIKEKEHDLNIKIFPLWVRRDDPNLIIADKGTKPIDTDEWSVSQKDYELCLKEIGVTPDVDTMASFNNTKCTQFFSRLPDSRALAVDFFWQPLQSGVIYYCCPPVKCIQKVINKIFKSQPGVKFMLLVPHWRSHPFYSALKDKNSFKNCITKHFIFNASFVSEASQCMFKGQKSFNMICLLIEL